MVKDYNPIENANHLLVGGWTHPSEKYESKRESSPNRGENKNIWVATTQFISIDGHDRVSPGSEIFNTASAASTLEFQGNNSEVK